MKNKKHTKKEYYEKNEWNPHTSKWKAAQKKGIHINIRSKDNILYLGASSGTTIKHLSKKTTGTIFAIELSPHMIIPLINLTEKNNNIAPILNDARNTTYTKEKLYNTPINILFQDIPSKDQIEILNKNAKLVDKKCIILLSLKTQSISQQSPKKTLQQIEKKIKKHYNIIQQTTIEPYHKKHHFYKLTKK